MDTIQLIKDIKARFQHDTAKQYLKDKYKAKLMLANQGGLWEVTPQLITFLDSAGSEGIYLEDSYGNPIAVKNRQELLEKARDIYNTVMEQWYNELQELARKR